MGLIGILCVTFQFHTFNILLKPLEKLLLADNKMRLGASALFDCLGTNETITTIDIR